jgi:hypothetical protein
MYEHYSTGWYSSIDSAMKEFVEQANTTKCAIVCFDIIQGVSNYRIVGILTKLYNTTS